MSAGGSDVIGWERDDAGIVTLALDDPGRRANTMNERYVAAMGATLDRLEAERDSVTGVVVTSAKKSFFAGADLDQLISVRPDQAAEIAAATRLVKSHLRRLETLGRPVVAAINGAALGGGFEIALACHHRVVADDDSARVGFPEVTLGLLPAAGGVVRTVRLIGLADALTKLLAQGQRLRPADALAAGVVDEVVPAGDLIPAAKAWIAANPRAAQPWDRPGYRMPGGTPASPSLAAMLPAFPANLRKQLKGAHYPAPHNILCAAVEGAQVDFDTAQLIEERYFVELVTGQVAKNMTKAFFFDLETVNGGASRPSGVPPWQATKVAVLGAGMMGGGIALACAAAGMSVLLKDVSMEAATRGRDHAARVLDRQVSKGRRTAGQRDEVLGRITPVDDVSALTGCDLVIEAVFEDTALKHQVFAEVGAVVAADALLASNTSSLPITSLATAVNRPEDFVGLHFFSPVDRMPLVEIVRGAHSSDSAIARAYDVVRQLGKTPIVVNDSRGFFTSRVIGTYLMEGVAMLGEGLPAPSIERAALQAGYPTAPLALIDEVSISLSRRLRNEARAALGDAYVAHPAEAVLDRMLDEFKRPGRAAGGGFYDYEPSRHLWPGLAPTFARPGAQIPFADMKERFLFAEALEALRCLDEGVITSVPEANIGSLFGIGFPPWTGGVLQYIDAYPGGRPAFAARAHALATRYGPRFTPPPSLP